MIESTVLSLSLVPHHTARANKLRAEEGRIKKKGQNKSNFNTNGQKPQNGDIVSSTKNLEQNFILEYWQLYVEPKYRGAGRSVILQLTDQE